MQLAEDLLKVLLCPEARQPLYYFPPAGPGDGADPAGGSAGFLFCPASRRKYRIEQGIPVMLVDDSELLGEDQAAALADQARQGGLRLTGPG